MPKTSTRRHPCRVAAKCCDSTVPSLTTRVGLSLLFTIHCSLVLKYSRPSVSAGDWFQDSRGHQNLPMLMSLIKNGLHVRGNLRMRNHRIQRTNCVFIEKNPHISGAAQFKSMLFKVRLCLLCPLYICIAVILVWASHLSQVLSASVSESILDTALWGIPLKYGISYDSFV